MCRILSAKQPINTSIILTFYERRLNRIVPLYLTVISTTLFLLYYLVDSTQFHQINAETLPSLLFISNWPRETNTDYFDSVNLSIRNQAILTFLEIKKLLSHTHVVSLRRIAILFVRSGNFSRFLSIKVYN
jgi:hypothetical protein